MFVFTYIYGNILNLSDSLLYINIYPHKNVDNFRFSMEEQVQNIWSVLVPVLTNIFHPVSTPMSSLSINVSTPNFIVNELLVQGKTVSQSHVGVAFAALQDSVCYHVGKNFCNNHSV
jgi:hypothetical protein